MDVYIVIMDVPDDSSEIVEIFRNKDEAVNYCTNYNDDGPDYEVRWVHAELKD